jgi:hypothetical protein
MTPQDRPSVQWEILSLMDDGLSVIGTNRKKQIALRIRSRFLPHLLPRVWLGPHTLHGQRLSGLTCEKPM